VKKKGVFGGKTPGKGKINKRDKYRGGWHWMKYAGVKKCEAGSGGGEKEREMPRER